MSTPLLEVCVADPESLAAAIAGGADRIELCSALELGGLTPSPGLMQLAARAPMPVYAMVRPRTGDFVYSSADIEVMFADIEAVRSYGLAGVVMGASRENGELDTTLLKRLLDVAAGLGSTLHRAIDLVPEFPAATEAAIELGFERILSSGGAHSALDGIEGLKAIHGAARGLIKLMAGSGLGPDNVAQLLDAVPADEVHSSCGRGVPTIGSGAVRLGFAADTRRQTDASIVKAFKRQLATR